MKLLKYIFYSVKELKWLEKLMWAGSAFLITATFLLTSNTNFMTLTASLIGVTALVFVAKGNVLGQFLTVVFALLYAVVSYQFHYWGEIITYLLMTAPIAAAAVASWIRHPFRKGEVEVRRMRGSDWVILLILTAVVTVGFYFILRAFDTPNMLFSTISIATSFSASALVMLRSEYYGIAYGLNDIVLIVLWVLASREDASYIPMILCFSVFFVNDLYGFYNWQKMKRKQYILTKTEK